MSSKTTVVIATRVPLERADALYKYALAHQMTLAEVLRELLQGSLLLADILADVQVLTKC